MIWICPFSHLMSIFSPWRTIFVFLGHSYSTSRNFFPPGHVFLKLSFDAITLQDFLLQKVLNFGVTRFTQVVSLSPGQVSPFILSHLALMIWISPVSHLISIFSPWQTIFVFLGHSYSTSRNFFPPGHVFLKLSFDAIKLQDFLLHKVLNFGVTRFWQVVSLSPGQVSPFILSHLALMILIGPLFHLMSNFSPPQTSFLSAFITVTRVTKTISGRNKAIVHSQWL